MIVLALLPSSCRQDLFNKDAEPQLYHGDARSKFQVVSLKDIPHVTNFIKKKTGRNDLQVPITGKSNALAKGALEFSSLETDLILQTTIGEASYYTFSIVNAGDESTIYNFEVKEEGGDVVRAELIEYASDQPFDEDFGNLLRFTGTVTAYNELKQTVAVGIFEEGINGECPPNNDPGNGGGSAGGSENYPSPKPVYPGNPGSRISAPGWPGNNTGSNTGGGDTGCWEIITAGSIDQFAEDPEKTVG